MALITLRQLLDHAAEHGYGVPAFNINNMEQGLAIMEAAEGCDAPVILQASRGARKYAGDIMLRHMVQALAEMFPGNHIVMHQDHGNNDATCLSAIRHGFTSVMMDGSLKADGKTPASYDYNVAITAAVSQMAHAVGASVEGELGVLGSLQSRALHTGQPAEDSGSYFLLDMIAVLDWTRRNCAAFGCDPDNLTLAGQSAGAVAVLGLLRSPLAKGSFARAISFSGIPFSASAQTGQQRTAKLLGELLRQRADDAPSVDDWLTAQPPQAQRDFLLNRSTTELLQASGIGLPPAFVADGHVLMALDEDEADEPAPQVVSEVPLLIGRTDDEMSTLAGFKNVGASAGARWPLVNGEPRDATIHQTLGLVQRWQRRVRIGLGDWLVGRKLRQFERAYAAQLPAVYVYRFAWDDYPEPWRSDFGTLHGLDLPFVFGNFIDDQKSYMRFAWTPQNEAARQRLHEQITSSLRHFVHTGQPSPAASDSWPPWGQHEYVRTWDQ